MEDFSKPVSPYRGRGRGNYVPRTIFNPAADVLAGIEYVEGTFKQRRDKVNLFQQQAEQRRIDMQKLVNDTQRIDQTDTMAKMTDQFSNMVTDIYKADIASFDGDRSDYLVKANNAQKVIGDFGKVIGTVNELSNKYLDMNPAEQKKMVLRNQFIGENGDKRKAYMKFLNDPSKMNIRIQGEDIIITNDGQDLFNGTQLLNSVKDGNNLIEYADDYTEQIGAASKDAMSGIKNLVVAKQYETMAKDGSRITTTAKNDYLAAVDQYKKNLENSDKVDALLNESTFQRYIDGDENYNSQKHDAATKEAIIDQLIIKEFPMYKEELKKGKIIRTATGDRKVVTKLTKQPSQLELQKLALERAKLNQKIKEFEEEQKGPDISKTPTGYVDRQNTALSTAINSNNKEAVKNIINTEISSASGVDPKSITFDGDKLTIVTEKSTGEKAYTAEQAKLINDAAGTTIIGRNGTIIDEDGFKTLSKSNPIEEPEGKPIEKPGQTIVVDNYKSANGEAQLLNILARNRFSTAKDISESLTHIEELTGVKLQEEVSGQRSAEQLKIQKANLKALKSDASKQSNNEQLVSFNNPGSEFSKNAINFFKSLPSDFIVDTYDYGKITVEEYLSKPSIKLGDLYNHYASAYEEVIKNASKYPDTVLSYTSLENIKQDNKKTAYTKKS